MPGTAWTPRAVAARRKAQAVRRALLSRLTQESTQEFALARAKAAKGATFEELWTLAKPFVGIAYYESHARLPAEFEQPWLSLLRRSLLKLVAQRTTEVKALLTAVTDATEQGRSLESELLTRIEQRVRNGGLGEEGVYDLARVDGDVATATERYLALVKTLQSAKNAHWIKVELPRTRAK